MKTIHVHSNQFTTCKPIQIKMQIGYEKSHNLEMIIFKILSLLDISLKLKKEKPTKAHTSSEIMYVTRNSFLMQ